MATPAYEPKTDAGLAGPSLPEVPLRSSSITTLAPEAHAPNAPVYDAPVYDALTGDVLTEEEALLGRIPTGDDAATSPSPALLAATWGAGHKDDPAAWEAERARRLSMGIDWYTTIWLGTLHVGALAAFWTFSWYGLALCAVMGWLTGGVGICLGFHRLLTHQSFRTQPLVKYTLAFIGQLAGEGSALYWVATHRKHHAHSDHVGDPHSPLDGPYGGLWAHMMWLFPTLGEEGREELFQRWAPDLAKDPVIRFLDTTFLVWHVLLGVAFGAVGYALGGWELCASLVVWGMFVRLVYVLHSTWFVNSATHMWGYRNYETTDESTNLWWVAITTYGEGWHNNHHAYPRMVNHGHQWWEFDLTYNTVRLMQACGIAWDLVDYKTGKERHAHPAPGHEN